MLQQTFQYPDITFRRAIMKWGSEPVVNIVNVKSVLWVILQEIHYFAVCFFILY